MHLIKQSNMMKCTLEPGEKLNESQFLELCANTQGIFLPCQKAQLNGTLTLLYDAKAYNTLESCASHLTAKQFRQVLHELLRMLRTISQQTQLSALKMGNLQLEFDKIYIHNDTLKPALVYTPVENSREFPEEEFRTEISETIQSNESLCDESNNEICRYLKSSQNELFGLIDLIPTLQSRMAPVQNAAPVTAQSEKLQRLEDENKRMKRQIQILLGAVVAVFLLVLILFFVLRGSANDASAQETTTTATTTTTAPVEYERGDLNGDGKINDEDITMLQQAIDGSITLNEAQRKAADINGDGKINASDDAAMMLLQKS
ncbi:MAG: hypothetical protein E7501_04755 [Ruminococcus sp.]|nr:hypothetical protein [Ruminococcus sp.]